MQVKLLRVLQEKQLERVGGNQPIDVDVRIISATNQDIKEKIKCGDFRIELFYRLNVVPIHIPPLRERIEDIPLLANHFIREFNKNFNKHILKITTQALSQLMQHAWPGNVRELENVLERAFVTTEGETIDTIILSHDIQQRATLNALPGANIDIPFKVARAMVEKRFEKTYLSEALERYEGNVSKTAKETGINPRTLWRKIKKHELERSMFNSSPKK
jgi:DNA-binding NtrC family response regulator